MSSTNGSEKFGDIPGKGETRECLSPDLLETANCPDDTSAVGILRGIKTGLITDAESRLRAAAFEIRMTLTPEFMRRKDALRMQSERIRIKAAEKADDGTLETHCYLNGRDNVARITIGQSPDVCRGSLIALVQDPYKPDEISVFAFPDVAEGSFAAKQFTVNGEVTEALLNGRPRVVGGHSDTARIVGDVYHQNTLSPLDCDKVFDMLDNMGPASKEIAHSVHSDYALRAITDHLGYTPNHTGHVA